VAAPNVSLNPQVNSSSVSNQQVIVAGVSSGSTFDIINENSEEANSEVKGINVNLAWLVVLIPAGLAYVIIKRKFNPLKFLLRKTV
jgi:hypothetical protein